MRVRPRTFLVTGVRAPAALEIIRRLGRAGHDVVAADCVRLPVGRFSRYVRRYYQVPAPREDAAGFIAGLRDIARDESVEMLLPTCEEIFHVGRGRETLAEVCEVFCTDLDRLATLHHKERFARLTQRLGGPVAAPESRLVRDAADLRAFLPESRAWVFKPVYSRFAARTLLCPAPSRLARLAPEPSNPWLAQRHVAGREVSSYSIAVRGRITAHTVYRSLHRVGQAAGIYFAEEDDAAVRGFVARLAASLDFTGQIAFDFIVCAATGRVFVLECNPRATSGVHLLGRDVDLARALCGETAGPPAILAGSRLKMLGAAMLLSGLGAAWRTGRTAEWRRDFLAGDDVVCAQDDPLPALGQFAALAEMAGRGLRRRVGMTAAMTADIEWNG